MACHVDRIVRPVVVSEVPVYVSWQPIGLGKWLGSNFSVANFMDSQGPLIVFQPSIFRSELLVSGRVVDRCR